MLIEIELVGGAVLRESLPPQEQWGIRRSEFDVHDAVVTMELSGIGEVAAEVGGPCGHYDPVDPRPIVYLDQNHWVTLAQYVQGSTRLLPAEGQAAATLVELAEARKVILPLSAAHYVETARAEGKWRKDLAAVMIRLSRGWVMRHPFAVEESELGVMFRNVADTPTPFPPQLPVFTLDPMAIWGRLEDATEPADGLSEDLDDLKERLSGIASLFSVLIENSRTLEGHAEAEAWADSYQGLGVHMGGNPLAKTYRRAITRAKVVVTMGEVLPRQALSAGLTEGEWRGWLGLLDDDAPSERDLLRMPYLGRMREVVHLRLSNSSEKWESNDLHDLLFLCCAAGYADVVVGERKHASYLQRVSRRFPEGGLMARNLRSAMPAIEELSTVRLGVD